MTVLVQDTHFSLPSFQTKGDFLYDLLVLYPTSTAGIHCKSLVFTKKKKKKFFQKGRGLLIALQIHEFQLLITFDKGTPYLFQIPLVSPKP